MPDTPKKLLLIEDDSSLGMRLRKGLQQEGYETWLARTGEEGLLQARQDAFDLLILDWMLPDLQGIDVLQLLRAESRRIPILFLTARDEVEDRVLGLDSGADDYLTKPFAFSELLARIRTLSAPRRNLERKVTPWEISSSSVSVVGIAERTQLAL
ncbi:MAG TPA: response regulator, partial [Terrimicrobiaceae bacterium]